MVKRIGITVASAAMLAGVLLGGVGVSQAVTDTTPKADAACPFGMCAGGPCSDIRLRPC